MTNEKLQAAAKLLASGTSPREIADILGLSLPPYIGIAQHRSGRPRLKPLS
jgi:hypothetical protein